MQENFLVFLGSLFLVTLIVTPIAEKFRIPRVSLFILCGFLLNYLGGDAINGNAKQWFTSVSNMTLLFLGYLLGTNMTREYLSQYAIKVTRLALLITLSTFVVVTTGCWLFGLPVEVALVLGAIAVATDPAATLDVLNQSRLKNQFTRLLEGIVALDDALGLILFTLVLATIGILTTNTASSSPLILLLWELLGALVWGAIAGFVLVFLLKQKDISHSVFIESLGLIMLCGGVALYLNLSFLLSAMVMGAVVVNFASNTQQHLHDIEFVEQPLLVLFFIMAGASLDLSVASGTLLIAAVYILLRIAGRLLSAPIMVFESIPRHQKRWLGIALLPQAGIAMGMALLAGHHLPQYQGEILAIAVTATVFFEIVGPVMTHLALARNHKG